MGVMDKMKDAGSRKVTDRAQVLADIALQLSRISDALAACAEEERSLDTESLRATRKTLKATQKTLTDLAWQLEEESVGQETTDIADGETVRLRQAVLENLYRRGPALFPELAAATLSLPDEIRPVLQAMEREGLVQIQALRGWETVSLTARGREAVRNAQGGTALR